MSKITFRADDDLVARLEEYDASKSEVMREALREFLDRDRSRGREDASRSTSDAVPQETTTSGAPQETTTSGATSRRTTLDDALAARVDELVEDRLGSMLDRRLGAHQRTASRPQDINLSINLDGARVDTASDTRPTPATEDASSDAEADASDTEAGCHQCGETLSDDHVYCPNCGEKRSHRVFCECGDEVRTDWAFCPSCGRRTPAADVLDRP